MQGVRRALIHAAGEAPDEMLQADLYQAADYIAEVLQGTEPPIGLHNTLDPF